jgi:nucleoside phosphorylase
VAELEEEAHSMPSNKPVVNVINIHNLSHASIQQGTVGSSQTVSAAATRQASQRADSGRQLVLLTVATDVERDAVLSVALGRETAAPQFRGDHTYFDLGAHGGCDILLVKTGMGAGGPIGSLATLLDATRDLSPSAIVMVGIAFGVSQEQQKIGDVLVSRQICCYECQRVTQKEKETLKIIPRGDRVTASPRLLDRFDSGSVGWNLATVRFGLILSGDKLVDSPSFKQQLLSLEPEAIGGEMEAAAMYASAYKGKVDWIMVKAICDWGENKRSPNKDQDQSLAAQNAAAFVFHVIRQGGLAH